MDHDKDYPFPHRTKLYRNLQTLCSKIYMMELIGQHYDENTFSPEKTGQLRPKINLAGFPAVIEDYDYVAPEQVEEVQLPQKKVPKL